MGFEVFVQVVFLSLFLGWNVASGASKMKVLTSWKEIDFEFPDKVDRQEMINSGSFIPGNSIPIDVQPIVDPESGDGRLLVTLPRLLSGVPATLATVPAYGWESPPLTPFPDWSWHRADDCNGLVSVFRVAVDSCGRSLWVLDTGSVDIFAGRRDVCPPKLLKFDVSSGRLLRRHVFPPDILKDGSLLVTVAVESLDSKCRETFAYVADVTRYGLLVYDERRDASWRVESNLLYPYPPWGFFDLNGDQFDLMDGVLGLAVTPDARLYFHSLASVQESWVPTAVLRNETAATSSPRQFRLLDGVRTSQSAAQASDRNAVIFSSTLADNAVTCWNTRRPYGGGNVVKLYRNNVTMQFASGVKVDAGQRLWILTSRLQKFIAGDTYDRNEVNFRILMFNISELVRGTSCEVRGFNTIPPAASSPFFPPAQKPAGGYSRQLVFPSQ